MLLPGDVIYCDPPYDGTFNGYHSSGFGDDEQYHLASILERRSSEGYLVIASNADTSLTSSLYRTFTLHRINAPRSIGIEAGNGKAAKEIIAVSRHHPALDEVDFAVLPGLTAPFEFVGGRQWN